MHSPQNLAYINQYPPQQGYEPQIGRVEEKPTTHGITVRQVSSLDEAWKIAPNRFTGDKDYYVVEEGDTVIFACQWYDADLPGTERRVFTATQQETVEPKRTPLEEQIMNMQNQLLEIKELLAISQKTSESKGTITSKSPKVSITRGKGKTANDKNPATNLEISQGISS